MPHAPLYGPRHREVLGQATVTASRTITYHQKAPFAGTVSVGAVGENRWMDDIVTPNFRSEQARGVVINNPCSWTKDNIERAPCAIQRTCSNIPKPGDAIAASWGAAPLPVPPADPAAYSLDWERLVKLACTSALGGIAPPDATSLLTLGELGETIALLRNPVEGLTTSFKKLIDLKRRYWRLKAAGLSVQAIANQYLAVMFGMAPLMADINMYLGLLSRFVPPRRTSRGNAQDSARRSETLPFTLPYNQPFSGFTTLEGELVVEVRAGSLYEYAYHDDLTAMFGLRLSDVPIAAWQLTRFSFLVDWAFNVGMTIRALTPVAGVVRLAEWYTVRSTCTETIKLSALTHDYVPGWTGSGGGDTVKRVVESYARYPCNLGDHIGLTYNVKWSPTKTLLSLALLTQTVSQFLKGKSIPMTDLRF